MLPGLGLVDDALAGSDWEQELYRLSLPEGSQAVFLTVNEARQRLEPWTEGEERVVVLTRDVASMLGLARGGRLRGKKVNLGGIHHAPGRTRVKPYLYLDDADRARVQSLVDEGVEVSARDLPTSTKSGLKLLLYGDEA